MGTMSQAFGRIVSSSNSGCVLLYPRPAAQCFFCPSCSFSLPVFLPLQRKHCHHLLCAMMSPLQIFFFFQEGAEISSSAIIKQQALRTMPGVRGRGRLSEQDVGLALKKLLNCHKKKKKRKGKGGKNTQEEPMTRAVLEFAWRLLS